MTLPDVQRLFDYWREHPPEHELVAMMARVYTTWRPEAAGPQPCTKISPSIGDFPPVAVKRPSGAGAGAPEARKRALMDALKAKGGAVSLEDLKILGNA